MANLSNTRLKLFSKLLFLGFLILITSANQQKTQWGFAGHQRINEFAVYLLPQQLQHFFMEHQQELIAQAVAPDQRRYIQESEAARHYIDLDHYYQKGENPFWNLPQNWLSAIDCHGEDTLMAHGIVPWHVINMKFRLQKAFEQKNLAHILKNAAEIGHYIADAHVPLHTTQNYNGQLTNQYGIHGLWESRLVELEASQYNYWIGQASYLPSVQKAIWQAIAASHAALDSVFQFEKSCSAQIKASEKYSFEQRGNAMTKVYSKKFCQAYHTKLNGMVERRMRAAILMVSSVWYTAWVDAGQPDLNALKMNANMMQAETDTLAKKYNFKWKERSCH
jgi:hypothetical protein